MKNEIHITAENFLRNLTGIEKEIGKFKKYINGETNYYGVSSDIDFAANWLSRRIARRAKNLEAWGHRLETLAFEYSEIHGADEDEANLARMLEYFKTTLNEGVK